MEHKYYPWQLELLAWNRARATTIGNKSDIQDLKSVSPAKFSNIIKCISKARNTTEVWGKFVIMDKKLRSGTLTKTEIDEGNFLESDEASSLLSQFTSWYRKANNIDDASPPYSSCFIILKEMANKEENEIDIDYFRKVFVIWGSLIDQDI